MDIKIPPHAGELFDKGERHSVDDSKVLAYGLRGVTKSTIEETCERATVSYAKEILRWPHGRIDKPDIFRVAVDTEFNDVDECAEHFFAAMQDQFDSSPPHAIPILPNAFLVLAEDMVPSHAYLVLAYKSDEQWKMDYCAVPVHVDLGLEVSSFLMGDMWAEDIVAKYPKSKPQGSQMAI